MYIYIMKNIYKENTKKYTKLNQIVYRNICDMMTEATEEGNSQNILLYEYV